MKKTIARAGLLITAILLGFLLLLTMPRPFFSTRLAYQNYEVWSDQAIPAEMTQVLDDVTRRLRTSEFHQPHATFRIFLCNAPWRLWIWGGHFSTMVGGNADIIFTRNIYIRSSDIAANRITLPNGDQLADAQVRPLSYYIAHEATHIIESREFGRLAVLRTPAWLMEGYADYVGKGGQFDFAENRALLRRGAALMDVARSGLYRAYHLDVAYLLDKRMQTARQLFANPPDEQHLRDLLTATH